MARFTWRRRLVAALIGLGALGPAGVGAQAADSSGVLVGNVIDRLGQPIAGVELVVVDARGRPAVRTVEGGAYRLEGIAPGPHMIRVRRLGYLAMTALVDVKPADHTEENFVLTALPRTLDPVVIQVENGELRSPLPDFYARRSRGLGTFLDRAELRRRNPTRMSDLARTIPGFRVEPDRTKMGGIQILSSRGPVSFASAICPVQLFVDGAPYRSENGLDDFLPSDIEAVEAYRGGAEVPPQLNAGSAGCGVIVLWLRR